MRFLLPLVLGVAAIACGASSDGTASTSSSSSGAGGGGGMCIDTGQRPGPRGEVLGAFDPKHDRVLFFGGDIGFPKMCNPAPKQIDELWSYDVRCKQFTEVVVDHGPPPSAR